LNEVETEQLVRDAYEHWISSKQRRGINVSMEVYKDELFSCDTEEEQYMASLFIDV